MVNNATEELVELLLQEMIQKEPQVIACKCDMCLDDIRAFTLNHLPTKYYAHTAGQAYMNFSIFEAQNRANALAALVQAVRTVNENPMHDKS